MFKISGSKVVTDTPVHTYQEMITNQTYCNGRIHDKGQRFVKTDKGQLLSVNLESGMITDIFDIHSFERRFVLYPIDEVITLTLGTTPS